METTDLQELCETGQARLMEMKYLEAEATLAAAERIAWGRRDFDTLARLYMPLQEARRQRRQRCGEGVVCLDLIAQSPHDTVDGRRVVENYPHGQLLVAGWASIEPAVRVRAESAANGLYVETFLAAVYGVASGRVVVIVPLDDAKLPDSDQLDHSKIQNPKSQIPNLPPHCIVLEEDELPSGSRPGTPETYAQTMALWERLHAPFLAAAEQESDPLRKVEAFRRTIRVDYACELAHQHLSDLAHHLARQQ